MKTSEALKICHEVVDGSVILTIKQYIGKDGVADPMEFSIYSHDIYHKGTTLEEAVQKFVAYHKKSEVEPVKDLESNEL